MNYKQKITKLTMAALLACSFSFSGTQVLANSNEEFKSVEMPTELEMEETLNDTTDQLNELEEPNVLPGEIFYFAKIMIEKIKLAITLDETKEAKLLSEFAGERLNEAEVLFQKGKEDLAVETLEKALERINEAEDEAIKLDDSDSEEFINEESSDEESIVKEEISVGDEAAELYSENESTIEDSTVEITEMEKSAEDDEDELVEVKKLISQNIIALSAAIEKVKNPKAKATLQKNIEKSYAKLARKIEKLEEKTAKKKQNKEEEADNKVEEIVETVDKVNNTTEEIVENELDKLVPSEDDDTVTSPIVIEGTKALKEERNMEKNQQKDKGKKEKHKDKKEKHKDKKKNQQKKDHKGKSKKD
ncbi:DUF5667 domain-containing protein [Bacillus sp. 2205SS5-2]|uniref:DUF5667 domain-containing protein n=1 Tax=Bacillus sp. 2205SS5-2 TaxID=3109031 RepID=UPI0030070441